MSFRAERSEVEESPPNQAFVSPTFFQTKTTPNSINLKHKINQIRPYSIAKSNQLQARTPGNE